MCTFKPPSLEQAECSQQSHLNTNSRVRVYWGEQANLHMYSCHTSNKHITGITSDLLPPSAALPSWEMWRPVCRPWPAPAQARVDSWDPSVSVSLSPLTLIFKSPSLGGRGGSLTLPTLNTAQNKWFKNSNKIIFLWQTLLILLERKPH